MGRRLARRRRVRRIHEERASGGRWDRPELTHLLGRLTAGDVLVVWKLDRPSRSLEDLLLILERITAAGAGFHSLTDAIDTTVPAGRMMMQMLGSMRTTPQWRIFQATISQLTSNIELIDLSGNRCLIPSSNKTCAVERGASTASSPPKTYSDPQPCRCLKSDGVVGGSSELKRGHRESVRARVTSAARVLRAGRRPTRIFARRGQRLGPAGDCRFLGRGRAPSRSFGDLRSSP
jgi:hypothetical protein